METKERIQELEKKTTNEQCVHHWVIDEFNVGRCIKCPAVRDFGALMKKYGELDEMFRLARDRSRSKPGKKRGRPSKQAINF